MHEANVVATELARSLKKLWGDRRFRIGGALVLLLLLSWLIIHRFSPKDAAVNCAFRITESANIPQTKGDSYKLDDCVQLEVASTNSARTLGLSGRQNMAANQGMLFDFMQPDEYCMWMKDMNFSIDIMWLNENKEIIYMIEGVTPDTYPRSFCGPESARYVVEVNSGIVKAGDLHIGQRLRF